MSLKDSKIRLKEHWTLRTRWYGDGVVTVSVQKRYLHCILLIFRNNAHKDIFISFVLNYFNQIVIVSNRVR